MSFPLRIFIILILLMSAPLTLQAAEATKPATLKLASSAFAQGGPIPVTYTCDGSDLSPPLRISGVPASTRSLALIVDDPDAPAGVWVHWVLWNIPAVTGRVERGTTPAGAKQGRNDWQRTGYRGPCPPSGTHRYYFRLYALSERLNLAGGASRADLDAAMQGKILDSAELVGTYTHK